MRALPAGARAAPDTNKFHAMEVFVNVVNAG
jgi:hypothetical protein